MHSPTLPTLAAFSISRQWSLNLTRSNFHQDISRARTNKLIVSRERRISAVSTTTRPLLKFTCRLLAGPKSYIKLQINIGSRLSPPPLLFYQQRRCTYFGYSWHCCFLLLLPQPFIIDGTRSFVKAFARIRVEKKALGEIPGAVKSSLQKEARKLIYRAK